MDRDDPDGPVVRFQSQLIPFILRRTAELFPEPGQSRINTEAGRGCLLMNQFGALLQIGKPAFAIRKCHEPLLDMLPAEQSSKHCHEPFFGPELVVLPERGNAALGGCFILQQCIQSVAVNPEHPRHQGGPDSRFGGGFGNGSKDGAEFAGLG